MKLRFGVVFGEVEIENLDEPFIIILSEDEFNKFLKHFEAESLISPVKSVLVYSVEKFNIKSFESEVEIPLKFPLIYQSKSLEEEYFRKLEALVKKDWEKYTKCIEKGKEECEEPLVKSYYRMVILFDKDMHVVKNIYLDKIITSNYTVILLRLSVDKPETVIQI